MAVHKTFDAAFKSLYRKMESVQKELPTVLASTGTAFFVGNFDKEGFDDGGVKSWVTPKRKIPGMAAFKYPKSKDLGRRTRKTLVKAGKLKRAVNNSVVERTFKRIVWKVTNVPYAAKHNYGYGTTPQRKYMGESKTLTALFKKKIIQAYKKSFK